jgi:NAD(P)-dependent dehydrogenase (short-subunit alcohol dehydrogenase family)
MTIYFRSTLSLVNGASKGGIYALTKGMAVELAPYKICVNAIAP